MYNAFTQTNRKTPTPTPITLQTLQKEINKLQHTVTKTKSIKYIINELPTYIVNKKMLDFITTQLKMLNTKVKGRRWSDDNISTALSIFHASPKTYRLLKQIFILPSVSLLQKRVSEIKIYPGFSENIIHMLGEKVKKIGLGSELCSLAIDEMSITDALTYNIQLDEIEGFEGFGWDRATGQVGDHVLVLFL